MTDALIRHCRATAAIDWAAEARGLAALRGTGVRDHDRAIDAHRRFVDTRDAARHPARAAAMHAALDLVRARAAEPMSWALLCAAQREILGPSASTFRAGIAVAKDGRERYGYSPELPALFAAKLERDGGEAIDPIAAAVRVYLDVCFFHPFDDGNGRAARIAFDHAVTRGGVHMAAVEPLFVLVREAGSEAGYRDMLRLAFRLASPLG